MNKFLMISIKTLTGIIVAVGGAYIAYEILKKYMDTAEPDHDISSPSPKSADSPPSGASSKSIKNGTPGITKMPKPAPSSNDNFHLSLVNGYLNKYQLNPKLRILSKKSIESSQNISS